MRRREKIGLKVGCCQGNGEGKNFWTKTRGLRLSVMEDALLELEGKNSRERGEGKGGLARRVFGEWKARAVLSLNSRFSRPERVLGCRRVSLDSKRKSKRREKCIL